MTELVNRVVRSCCRASQLLSDDPAVTTRPAVHRNYRRSSPLPGVQPPFRNRSKRGRIWIRSDAGEWSHIDGPTSSSTIGALDVPIDGHVPPNDLLRFTLALSGGR